MASRDVPLGQAAVALPRKRIRWGEVFVQAILFIAAAISVLTTLGIVLSLLLPAIDFFREVSPLEFFTGTTWAPLFLDAHFGVVPLVVGTFVISFWSALVAFPLGLGVAIYLSEYARPRAATVLKPILEIPASEAEVVLFGHGFPLPLLAPGLASAGIPSVVLTHGAEVWLARIPALAGGMRRGFAAARAVSEDRSALTRVRRSSTASSLVIASNEASSG